MGKIVLNKGLSRFKYIQSIINNRTYFQKIPRQISYITLNGFDIQSDPAFH